MRDNLPKNYSFIKAEGENNAPLSGIVNSSIVKDGKIIINYYYSKKDYSGTINITKDGTKVITKKNESVKYTINYTAEATDYIGTGTIKIIDYLPYKIDQNKSNLNGGTYNDSTKTITWNIDWSNIDTFDGEKKKEVKKEIELIYVGLNDKNMTLTNKVTGYLTLGEKDILPVQNEITSNIQIPGKVIIKYIDIDTLEDGDYKAYIVTESNGYIAKTIISNKVLKEQVATYKSKKTLTTRNNYRDSKIPLEFVIRSTPIGEKTANSTYNEYNQYRTLEFVNNKLKLFGTSYSMGMNLSKNTKVERKIVFENIKTFKKYTYDASSTTEGLYQVGTTLGDNLDKSRAWFSTEMDLSQIEKGEYAIYISTKSNISDYGELNELLFRSLDDVVLKKDNKTYSFRINKDLRYRIELIVK